MESEALLVLAPNARRYPPLLSEAYDAGLRPTVACSVDEANRHGAEFSIILGQPDLVAEYLAEGNNVRWVQSTWAGVTPLLSLGRRDFLLSGVKETFGPQVSEYVIGYLLGHELKLLERLGRQANRSWWEEPSGTLSGKTLGIMGTGSIGRHLATVASVFGLRVHGYSRSGAALPGYEKTWPSDQLHAFLATLDYLVCTLPETTETECLLDANAFGAVRRGCYLVNVGRGKVVDEEALLGALAEGRLAGAVLDVFREEPLPPYSPLWHAPDTLVTAHVAAKSRPEDIAAIFIENYGRYRRGEELKYRIDYERGY